ncbi:MAG: hypothetical protein WBM58_01615, partial [Sedimenticolaceae bacterium]
FLFVETSTEDINVAGLDRCTARVLTQAVALWQARHLGPDQCRITSWLPYHLRLPQWVTAQT